MGKKTIKKSNNKENAEKPGLPSKKAIDLSELKSKIKEEYLVSYEMNLTKEEISNSLYDQKYKEYLTEEFNVKCVFLIVNFIKTSEKIPDQLKQSRDLHKELLTIIRELMMNEFEISLYTMYIDDIGWEKKDVKTKLHLLCIGILTKCFTNLSIDFLINHFKQQNKDFGDFFLKWREDIKEPSFSTIEINERFKALNKSFNTACQKNYIDYNSVVDKIIQLSQPFDENIKDAFLKDPLNINMNMNMSMGMNMGIGMNMGLGINNNTNNNNNGMNSNNPLDLGRIPSFQPFQTFSFTKLGMGDLNNNNINANGANVNDPLMLVNPNGMKSFISISSKKEEQDENFLELFNSKSFVDQNPLIMKQPSDMFNFYSNSLRKDPNGSSQFDGIDFMSFNNPNNTLTRMKSNISNQGENRMFHPQVIQPSMNSMADVMKTFIKEKEMNK